MPGTITLRPLEANLTHNTDLLTKMNPYCSFILGGNKFTSQICKKGGKHPHWNDAVSLPFSNESTLTLELMDKDRLTKDDVIGGCSINLTDLQSRAGSSQWYPLFYKNKPAGEILLEAVFEGGLGFAGEQAGFASAGFQSTELLREQELLRERELLAANASTTVVNSNVTMETQPHKIFTEQHQVVEPHTFMKNVDVVETVPVLREIEVTEPRKVLKEVEYTEAVPVHKTIEVVEPQVVMKEVEVIEPRVVTKTIQVVENVPVKKQVEVVEMRHTTREVETLEPQTFTKTVEVTEQVPVKRTVQVSEPVTVTKAVEFVEPVITTQTIVKEVVPDVIVNTRVTTEVGPATLVGVSQTEVHRSQQQVWNQGAAFEQNVLSTSKLSEQHVHSTHQHAHTGLIGTEQHAHTGLIGNQQQTGFVAGNQGLIQQQEVNKELRKDGFFLDK